MRKLLFFSLVIGFILMAAPTLAAEYYVDWDNGSLTGDGTESNPYISFFGINPLAGDVINITGTSTGTNLSVNWNGQAGNPITLQAWEGQTAPIISNAVMALNGSYLVFDGFTITASNLPLVTVNSTNTTVSNCSFVGDNNSSSIGVSIMTNNVTVTGNTIDTCYTGVQPNMGVDQLVITGNVMNGAGNSNAGVGIGSASNLLINNNVFYNYNLGSLASIFFQGIVTNSQILNNTFYNNNGAVLVGEGSTFSGYHLLKNNNIYCNASVTGKALGDQSGGGIDGIPKYFNAIESDYNNFYNCSNYYTTQTSEYFWYVGLESWQNLGYNQDANSQEGDPVFTDAVNNDFSLQSSSKLIDAGTTLSNIIDDIDGISRPQGDAYDIGAYEYEVDTSVPGKVKISKFTKKKITLKKRKAKATYYKLKIFKYKKKKNKKAKKIISVKSFNKKN